MANLREELGKARTNLLDLGLRNRLLNFKLDGQRVVRVFDELADQVYNVLLIDKKAMKFAPSDIDEPITEQLPMEDVESALDQPDDSGNGDEADKRHTDLYLQTRLTSKALQTRLLRIESEAQVAIEEQGTNVLYLAVGFVKWFDRENSEEVRYAPLILIPAKLDRDSAGARFKLSWSEEDLATNESLAVKLKTEFGIDVPRLPSDVEDLTPSSYFGQVRQVLEGQRRWEVIDDIALGFFTFAKLLMWRDLDVELWQEDNRPDQHPIVRAILESSQLHEPSPYDDDSPVDRELDRHDVTIVTDADSSQTLAVLDTRDGRSIAIQGPPGTGKSQTITNIIACALAAEKTVLFVAEKMAALKVVKRRLDLAGLGDACLELHSFKSRKKYVVEKIGETLAAARPVRPDRHGEADRVRKLREGLNEFASAMNTPLVDGGHTPHRAIGMMQRHRRVSPALLGLRMPIAAEWTLTQFDENRALASLLSRHLSTTGNPGEHPWRGVSVDALLPADRTGLESQTAQLLSHMQGLSRALQSATEDLGFAHPLTISYADVLSNLCALLSKRPSSDLNGIINGVWQTSIEQIQSVVGNGHELAMLHAVLLASVHASALSQDFVDALEAYRTRGSKPLPFLHGDYRRARKLLKKSCLRREFPKDCAQATKLLEKLCRHGELTAEVDRQKTLGEKAFAGQWLGTESDWNALQRVVEWMSGVISLIETASASASLLARWTEISLAQFAQHDQQIRQATAGVMSVAGPWSEFLAFDSAEAFDADMRSVQLDCWIDRLTRALGRVEAVYEWVGYRRHRETCRRQGMDALVTVADQGQLTSDRVVPQFEHTYGEEVLRRALSERQVLRDFSGEDHGHLIDQFRALDHRLIDMTRQYLAAKLWERTPHPTIGDPEAGSMNYLTNQLRRKRGIPPVRELMSRAGDVITKVKPCFMMSPMSVAQFLPPDAVQFDMLVIDEASQMKPEDALGVIARCAQCVIVGDTKQLPPTGFFDKLVGGDIDDDTGLGDTESILDAVLMPLGGGRTLRWHYRSRHESLIAFSNKEFYDSKLHVFPSPNHECGDLGVIGHYIPNGVYGRAGSHQNLEEAEAVAQAVMSHATRCGELSLGVVALSKAQQEAIQDKLEVLRRQHPDLECFFSKEKEEEFFIKNLETVQGDERDVIFMSIGYGKDVHGYLQMNFGPVNREGGYRRLNVLITRARRRCEVFHSLKAEDIRTDDLSEAERQGLRGRVALRNYLAYVQTGQLEQPSDAREGEADSPFEEAVAADLERHGMIVHKQVGVANFRIDLAVVDPVNPGRYLLGVECDGATYHRAKSARDRDRLRQEVLEGLGWRIHRIWSLDWLKDQDKELRRLLLAVQEAKEDPVGAARALQRCTPEHSTPQIARTLEVKEPMAPHQLVRTVPYTKASVAAPCYWDPQYPPVRSIAGVVAAVVGIESPLHEDELVKRVSEVWGFGRTGSRIQRAVAYAREIAVQGGQVVMRGRFAWVPDMKKPPIRNRSELGAGIETVAPEEIRLSAEEIQKITLGLNGDSLITEVARCLGYARLGHQVRDYIQKALDGKT